MVMSDADIAFLVQARNCAVALAAGGSSHIAGSVDPSLCDVPFSFHDGSLDSRSAKFLKVTLHRKNNHRSGTRTHAHPNTFMSLCIACQIVL